MSASVLLALALAAASPAKKPAPKAEKSHPLDIRADHLTVLTKENRGVWKGHVHAVRSPENDQPQLDLRCDELVTEYAGEDKLEKVTCKGNVEVVQGDRAGWGELAVFDNEKGELVVTGNPRGKQGPNKFRGNRLLFYPNEDRLEVESPTVDTTTNGAALGGAGSGESHPRKEPASVHTEASEAQKGEAKP